MSKREIYLWTAAVGVMCIAVSVFLQTQGMIPDWAGTAVAVLPMVLLLGELEAKRKRGHELSLGATLRIILQASVVTALAVAFMLLLLSVEGFLFELAGVVAVALIAAALANLLRWLPATRRDQGGP